jgi:hypothetical protein
MGKYFVFFDSLLAYPWLRVQNLERLQQRRHITHLQTIADDNDDFVPAGEMVKLLPATGQPAWRSSGRCLRRPSSWASAKKHRMISFTPVGIGHGRHVVLFSS